ncbi:hypothetical protein V6N11_020518 [Hibiscus sabdariffa]|uniref:CCHC-type domain-containing protein n=1 Tax=Hibiscus sabdariffa TaxID=183260 RepID=A0ABR2Q8L7_9ROSI
MALSPVHPLALPDSSADLRLPKKQRRRDEDPPDHSDSLIGEPVASMECDFQSNVKVPVSYKDIVTGSGGSHSESENIDLDDDDIDLLEEDITLGSMNGIPTIDFSERVQALAVRSMELTLVVKILGRRIGYNTLHNRIYGIWRPSHPIKLIDIENDYFLVKFSDRRDYLRVLTEGPWTIFGHYLTVEQWSVDFQPAQAHPSRLMAWIQLPGLPLTLYKRSFIEVIGSQIGSVIKIDLQTDSGCRGRFARMAVSLNLNKPLVSKLIINGRPQIVEYESLPTVCFHCGTYGHLKDICPNLKISDDVAPMHSGAPPPAPVPGPSVPDEDFGPWMIVEKRKRNSRLPPQVNRVNHVNHTNPIFEEINPAQASTLDSREIAQISASPAIVQSAVNEDPLITDSVSTLSPLQTVKAT